MIILPLMGFAAFLVIVGHFGYKMSVKFEKRNRDT